MGKEKYYSPYQAQYYKILEELISSPDKKINSRVGRAYSSFVRQLRVDLRKEFPLMDIKQTSFNNILHELLWFLSGKTNIKYLVENKCYIWNDDAYRWYKDKFVPLGAPELTREEFVEKVLQEESIENDDIQEGLSNYEFEYVYGDLGTVYGHQWRNFNYDVDQLNKVIEALKKSPDTRQELIVTAQNPEDMFSGSMALPPCHNYFQFYTEPIEGSEQRYLSLYFNMRSCDFFLGNPYNIPSYSLLLMMVAQLVGMRPKYVVCNMVDCHLYEPHLEAAQEWMTRYNNRLQFSSIQEAYQIFGCKSTVTIDGSITDIDQFKFEHFKLENYKHEGKIKAPLLT